MFLGGGKAYPREAIVRASGGTERAIERIKRRGKLPAG